MRMSSLCVLSGLSAREGFVFLRGTFADVIGTGVSDSGFVSPIDGFRAIVFRGSLAHSFGCYRIRDCRHVYVNNGLKAVARDNEIRHSRALLQPEFGRERLRGQLLSSV